MFGNNGAEQPKLRKFLELQRETDLDTAFGTAFGKSYSDATAELRSYLQRGRYGIRRDGRCATAAPRCR
jgi:hypothetical protein